ncbi:hypothetical protein VaNZ11_008391 [Volvox africanus]|uniref:SET domain-containing protein n=1 Tax=Volvox africanus TaxID=51714 RepID=A0ABQ5S5R3_9CHLO|nr:hypothetical protein VaNZ11_008391 [Volvox africanus]
MLECAPEQVFQVLLLHLPFNRDIARLGTSCAAAASALRFHLAALHRDFSLGAEPWHSVGVQPLPACSVQCPVPLNFTYNAALGLPAGGGGLLTGDDGCSTTCACYNRSYGHHGISLGCSGPADGVALGADVAATAAAAGTAVQPDSARIPVGLHRGGTPGRTGYNGQDQIETDGARHPCKEAAAQKLQTGPSEHRNLMESDGGQNGLSSSSAGGWDGCGFSSRDPLKDYDDGAFALFDDVRGGYGQHDDGVTSYRSCPCGIAVPSGQPAYDTNAVGLSPHVCSGASGGGASAAYILECGPACACSPACAQGHTWRQRERAGERGIEETGSEMQAQEWISLSPSPCPARLTQGGLVVQVAIRWQEAKGWGVVALEPIPARRFVCLYGGEYITTAEAAARLHKYDAASLGHALLVVREILPSGLALRINIDATLLGNIARFFNHSCDGGNMTLMVVRRRGSFIPAVALFASRNVTVGEELTFAYGTPSWGNRGFRTRAEDAGNNADSGGKARGLRPCLCGTPACLGYMPSDEL